MGPTTSCWNRKLKIEILKARQTYEYHSWIQYIVHVLSAGCVYSCFRKWNRIKKKKEVNPACKRCCTYARYSQKTPVFLSSILVWIQFLLLTEENYSLQGNYGSSRLPNSFFFSRTHSQNLSRNNLLTSYSYVNGIISKFFQYYGKFTSFVKANRLPSEMLVVWLSMLQVALSTMPQEVSSDFWLQKRALPLSSMLNLVGGNVFIISSCLHNLTHFHDKHCIQSAISTGQNANH